MPATTMARPRARLWLWTVLVLSFVLKVALLIPAHNISPVRDSTDYVLGGQTIALTGTYPGERPPLYPAVLGATFAMAAGVGIPMPGNAPEAGGLTGLDIARFVQVVMSTVSVWLVYLLGRRLFDARGAVTGAAVFAFYPNFVAFSHLLWSETLFTMLNLSAVLLLLGGLARTRLTVLLGAGLCFGLAALTRQVGLTLIPWIVLWVILLGAPTWRTGIHVALVVVFGALLVIAPWTARNRWKFGQFVAVTAVSGTALLWGASPNPEPELKQLRRDWPSGPERDAAAGRRAVEIIRADPVGWLRRCLTRHQLWSLGFDGVIMHLGQPWGYPAVNGRNALFVVGAIVGAYVLVTTCAIPGMALAPDWRTTLLFVGFAAVYSILHFLASGFPRHRLPLMAYACIYAGYFVSRRPAELRALARPLRVALATTALVTFFVAATVHNGRFFDELQRLDEARAAAATRFSPGLTLHARAATTQVAACRPGLARAGFCKA